MKLYFIVHRVYNPTTGGEIYNEALLEGAEKAGLDVIRIEGQKYKTHIKNIFLMNVILLYRIIAIKKNDLLLLDTDFHARYILGLLWAKYIKKVTIYGMLHHFNYLDKEKKIHKLIHYYIEKFVSLHFDGLITNGQFSLSIFKNITNNKEIKYFIIPPFSKNEGLTNGRRVIFDEKIVKLIQVGTIEPRKNVLTILKCLKKVTIPFHIDFVGKNYGDKYYNDCLEFVKANMLQDQVIFHGKVDIETLQKLYSSSSVFILVSRLEGYGMTYAESMQYGLPIIGSKTGAVPDLVEDGVNGILCDPHNEDEIVNAIHSLRKKDFWTQISDANYQKAKSFHSRKQFVDICSSTFSQIRDIN